MNVTAQSITTPDYEAIKLKQNAAWASGDYGRIGVTLQLVGETLAEAMDLMPGMRVLDVAAGNGNATLAAARRGCHVMSSDYVEQLLGLGRRRAEADGQDVMFRIADAENLPFDDASFDAVISTFGVMFAPNQLRAADELIRVCRSGGRIGLANWTPDGFIGQMFKILGGYVPPAPGLKSPAMWGAPAWIDERFAPSAANIRFETKMFVFRYASPEQFVSLFRDYYGPVHKAFLALDASGQKGLERDLLALIGRMNTRSDGSMHVPSAYGEIVIDKA